MTPRSTQAVIVLTSRFIQLVLAANAPTFLMESLVRVF